MAERDGLSPLKVGVAGHNSAHMGPRLFHQHPLQPQHKGNDMGDFLLHIQPEIGGHLVVPGAGGVQPLARLADALGKQGLDVHVDVLVIQGELHLVRLHIRQNGGQALHNSIRLGRLNNSRFSQHRCVGNGAPDVLLIQPGIKADGRIKVVHQGVGFLLESARPEFHMNYLSLCVLALATARTLTAFPAPAAPAPYPADPTG